MALISLLALPGNNDVDIVSTVHFRGLFIVSPVASHVRVACLPWVPLPLTIFIMVLIIHESNVQSSSSVLLGTNSSAFENISQILTKYLLKFLCKLGEYIMSSLVVGRSANTTFFRCPHKKNLEVWDWCRRSSVNGTSLSDPSPIVLGIQKVTYASCIMWCCTILLQPYSSSSF